MSEVMLQQSPVNLPGQEVMASVELSSTSLINNLEQKGVVIENKEATAASLDTLRGEFGIDDRAFDRPRDRMMLVAIADKLRKVDSANLSVGQFASEREYIADLVMDSVGQYTQYSELFSDAVEMSVLSDEHIKSVYDKYTQPEVTRELDEYVRGEAFDSLRTRLGVADEEPYEIRVLSIDSEENMESFGLDPGIDWESQEWQESNRELEFRKAYFKGLAANGKQFVSDLGRGAAFAPAWVTNFKDGTTYLCMSLPAAEKILYKNEERARYYGEEKYGRDHAVLEHEYTHTQKMIAADTHIGVGIGVEELRAEHFSGDKHGYADIKKYFIAMKAVTGYSPKSSFESGNNGFDEGEFLEDIAKNVGLQGLLDVMTVIPGNYVADEKTNPYVQAIVAHNGGGLTGQFQKLYDREVKEQGAEAVNDRISAMVDGIRDILRDKGLSVEAWMYFGGIRSFAKIATENFRSRYPDETDGYDYEGK